MRKIIICVVCLFLLVGCNNSDNTKKTEIIENQNVENNNYIISESEAIEIIEHESVILLDVRTNDEYKSIHLINSINIPVDELSFRFENEVKIEKDTKILVYCKSGVRASNAVNILRGMGYTNTYSIGGINTWSNEKYLER